MHLLLLALSCSIAFTFAYDCPPQSSQRPSLIELTRSDGACGYRAYLQTNEHNDSYLDIYLEGIEKGWVAIGFSKDQKMANSDVIGCKQDASGTVGIFNTWNGQHPPNVLDPTQDGMCNYESKYTDGKFSCLFSRYHGVINPGFDYDLYEDYYFLLGCSTNQNNQAGDGFAYHAPNNPESTDSQYNVLSGFNGSAQSKPSFERRMIRAHGILMVIAYPVLLVTAVFFAAWMKPTLPKLWFQLHRAIMLTSLGIALIAFMLIFIANKDNPTPGIINLKDCGFKTIHFVFGIAAVALHLINPILGLIRCKPDSPHRWIFNIVHGAGIGLLTELLALTNIALGTVIFQSNCAKITFRNIILYLYLGWCVLLICIQMFMFVYFTVKSFNGDLEEAPMLVKIYCKFFPISTYSSINDENKGDIQKKEDAVRYGVFVFQFGLTLIIGIVLMVVIAVDNFN